MAPGTRTYSRRSIRRGWSTRVLRSGRDRSRLGADLHPRGGVLWRAGWHVRGSPPGFLCPRRANDAACGPASWRRGYDVCALAPAAGQAWPGLTIVVPAPTRISGTSFDIRRMASSASACAELARSLAARRRPGQGERHSAIEVVQDDDGNDRYQSRRLFMKRWSPYATLVRRRLRPGRLGRQRRACWRTVPGLFPPTPGG